MRRNCCLLVVVFLVMIFPYDHLLGEEEESVQNPMQILEQSEIKYYIDACPDDSNPFFSYLAPSLDPNCVAEKLQDSIVITVRNPSELALSEIMVAESLLWAHETEKAREHYLKALGMDSLYLKLYVFIGDTYFGEQRYHESEKWYKKALEKNPFDYQAYRFLAEACEYREEFEEALNALVSALIYNMNYDIAWADLHRIGLKLGLQINRHPFRQRCWMERLTDTTYQICIDSSVAASPDKFAAWLAFIAEKAVWRVEGKFFQEYVTAEEYHLTLYELYDCFEWLITAWLAVKKENPQASDPDLDFISKVAEDGFLREYILLEALSQLDIHLLLELNLRDNLFPRFRKFFFRYYIVGT